MTDHDDDRNDDEMLDWLRQAFDRADNPPHEYAGETIGLTREDLLAQNEAAGTWAEVTIPGKVDFDVDGVPSGVGPSTTEAVYRGPTVVTRSQLAALDLTPEDVPNLVVMDDPPERQNL